MSTAMMMRSLNGVQYKVLFTVFMEIKRKDKNADAAYRVCVRLFTGIRP